ncbi:hypothetical protein QLX08_003566 [Tetragonisca angustula]|uniref:Uncharacterized protein n=1 Tax=Tetragonisca angustula TaxID=166442 RepID=A0AAW1A698_9HYME
MAVVPAGHTRCALERSFIATSALLSSTGAPSSIIGRLPVGAENHRGEQAPLRCDLLSRVETSLRRHDFVFTNPTFGLATGRKKIGSLDRCEMKLGVVLEWFSEYINGDRGQTLTDVWDRRMEVESRNRSV